MATNPSIDFLAAQGDYLRAKTIQDKIVALEKMISLAPKHKGSEKLLADLRSRLAKLKKELNKEKIKKKSFVGAGIKKEGIQVAIIGLTNSGKSSLLSNLTNAQPKIDSIEFTTIKPIIGILYYEGIKFQIIEVPAVNSENFDRGITNSADILINLITSLKDLEVIFPTLEKATGNKIIVFNKIDLLSEQEKRKISAYLQSKKYNYCFISCKNKEGLEELKKKLIENSGVIRVFTKQPKKEKDETPILIRPNSTVEDLIKKIFHSNVKVKEIRITGPSSKFPNQTVGFKHILKDNDIVEVHTQ